MACMPHTMPCAVLQPLAGSREYISTVLCRAAATGRFQAWGVGNGYKRPAFRKFCGVGNFSESVAGVWGWADQDCNAQHIFICEIRRERHLPCAMHCTTHVTHVLATMLATMWSCSWWLCLCKGCIRQ
jgi:hypothetical protein